MFNETSFYSVSSLSAYFNSGCATEKGHQQSQKTDSSVNTQAQEKNQPRTPQPETTQPPIKETPKIATKQPSEMILNISDFPDNYSLKEKGPRPKSEVSEEGIKLGWQNGYYASYSHDGAVFTFVDQWTSIYPPENILKVFDLAKTSDENATYAELPIDKIGERSRAWRVTTLGKLGDMEIRQSGYRIEFIKLNVYTTLVMSGFTTDFELLKDLAIKAERKIQ